MNKWDWLQGGFVVFLLLLVVFTHVSNAKQPDDFVIDYNGTAAHIKYKSNESKHADVELLNSLFWDDEGYHFLDCGENTCLVRMRITPYHQIVLTRDEKITGFLKYPDGLTEVRETFIDVNGEWVRVDFDASPPMKLEKDSSYVFGVEFWREDSQDAIDIVPITLGLSLTEFAWWDAYQPPSGAYTNITSCGSYNDNNTVYFFTQDILVTDNSSCLTFGGINQTINGAFHSVSSTDVNVTGISFTGQNITLENLTINKFFYGLFYQQGSENIHLKYVGVNGSEQCIRFVSLNTTPTSESSLTSVWTRNCSSYGLMVPSSVAVGVINITNSDLDGSTWDIYAPAGSSNIPVDGGNNYWDTCSGNCAWYAISHTTNETGFAGTYTTSTNPNTNYCSATTAPYANINKRTYNMFRDLELPPARVYASSTASIYTSHQTPSASTYAYFHWILTDFDECVITRSSGEPLGGAILSSVLVGSTSLSWRTTGSFAFTASAIENASQRGYIGIYADNGIDGPSNAWLVYQPAHATYKPYLTTTWRHSFYDAPMVNPNHEDSGIRYYLKQAMGLFGATYCSFSVPNAYTPTIYDSVVVSPISTTYNASLNSTHYWLTFPCSARSYYTAVLEETLIFITNETSCGSFHDEVGVFQFYDEQNTSSQVNGSASAVITSTELGDSSSSFSVEIDEFRLCKSKTAGSFDADIEITYQNSTAQVRNYHLSIDQDTNFSATPIHLLLLSGALTSNVQFVTKNQFGVALPNRVQHYLRYFPANNSYVLVAMGETDADGSYVANIFTNGSTFYQIISFYPDSAEVEKLFTQELVYCIAGQSCTHNLIIQTSGEDIAPDDFWQSFYGDVQSNCSFTNATRTIACTYADSSGQPHTFDLNASRLSYGNPVSVCNATSSGASGTLLCTISDANLSGNVYVWRFVRKSDITIIQQGTLDLREVIFATLGLGVAFLLVITTAMIGMFNPLAGVILGGIGLIAASIIGLIDIPIAALAGIILVGIIFAWRFSKH